jgi:D-3-phosphoglycerate dehydrogenase
LTWRIAISDGLAEEGQARLRREAEIVDDPELTALGSIDGWIVRSRTRVTDSKLEAAGPRLKVVGRAGVGVDNIDLEAARRRAVIVVNSPLAATQAVAELALGLMFALARHIPQASAAVHRGEWPKSSLTGAELAGKTLGLVGVGRIGAALAQRAGALGMQVMGYDPLLSKETIRLAGAQPASFDEVLAGSDYLSLHVPLTAETRNLIGEHELQKLKPGARLISTARGGVVDEVALSQALARGQVGGAALDVFDHEPPGDSPLLRDERVIATPHLGAQTAEAQTRASLDIVEEVLAALAGRPLRWRVA